MPEHFPSQAPVMPPQQSRFAPPLEAEQHTAVPKLPEGQTLVVRRKSGEMDPGWTAQNALLAIGSDGTAKDYVVVTKPHVNSHGKPVTDEQGNPLYLEKTVPYADLISWQPQPQDEAEADTIKRIPKINWSKGEQGAQPENPAARAVSSLALQGAMQPEAPAHAAEKGHDARLKKIFAPYPKLEDVPAKEKDRYDYLFAEDEAVYQAGLAKILENDKKREEALKKVPVVTEPSRELSAGYMQSAGTRDPKIAAILQRHMDKNQVSDYLKLTDLLRTNPEFRYELGSYFMDKLQAKAEDMPHRVRRNTQKTPSHLRTYQHFRDLGVSLHSREYASLLALSMLDGSFEGDGNDPFTYNAQGQLATGQHRAAAISLITTDESVLPRR